MNFGSLLRREGNAFGLFEALFLLQRLGEH